MEETETKVLFVDDEAPVLKALCRFGRSNGWLVKGVESAQEALEVLKEDPFDIIVSDMRMPGMNGAEFLAEVKLQYPKTVRILLTGYSDIEALEQAINTAGIFNYLSKPWDEFMLSEIITRAHNYLASERERERLEALTREQNKKLAGLARLLDKKSKERAIEIEQALTLLSSIHERSTHKFVESLKILNQILDWKEGRDAGHNRFVIDYAERMGRRLGMDKLDIENTSIAASLHRVGALGLPDSIREKPQYKFTESDKELFAKVPVLGGTALSKAPDLQEVATIVRHQCEWVNGCGYPDQLIDRDIPKASKIIHIVSDFYDVYNGRVDEHIRGVEGAKKYIKEWTGKKYDTALVAEFMIEMESFDDGAYLGVPYKVTNLKVGMILDEDIISNKGILLLSAATKLTNTQIQTLKDYEETLKEQFTVLIRGD